MLGCQCTGNKTNEVNTTAPRIFLKEPPLALRLVGRFSSLISTVFPTPLQNISCSFSLVRRLHANTLWKGDLVQYPVELRAHLVSFSSGDVTKCAIRLWLRCSGQSLWFRVTEIEVSPAPRGGETLGILDGHIRAIERTGKISASRRLRLRAIGNSDGPKVSCNSLKESFRQRTRRFSGRSRMIPARCIHCGIPGSRRGRR